MGLYVILVFPGSLTYVSLHRFLEWNCKIFLDLSIFSCIRIASLLFFHVKRLIVVMSLHEYHRRKDKPHLQQYLVYYPLISFIQCIQWVMLLDGGRLWWLDCIQSYVYVRTSIHRSPKRWCTSYLLVCLFHVVLNFPPIMCW